MGPTEASAPQPSEIPADYYQFGSYVSKTRMLTFWYQLDEVLKTKPRSVLEVGVGPGVVAGTLRERKVDLTTVDVNPELSPDYLVSVTELDSVLSEKSFDVVLCARVLHHLPFDQVESACVQLARVARERVVLTLPVDDARVYLAARRTAGQYRVGSFAIPMILKRLVQRASAGDDDGYRQLWKIGSAAETSPKNVTSLLNRHFRIIDWYGMPEDRSHAVIVAVPR